MKPIRITGFKRVYRGLLGNAAVRVFDCLVLVCLLFIAATRIGGFGSERLSQLFTAFFNIRLILPLAPQLLVFFGLQETSPASVWFARCKKWVILTILSAIANCVVVTLFHASADLAPYIGIRRSVIVFAVELAMSGLLFVCLARGMWETIYNCGGEEQAEQRLLGLELRVWVIWTAEIVLSLLFIVFCRSAVSQVEGLSRALQGGSPMTTDGWILLALLAGFFIAELWRTILRVRFAIESRRVWKAMDVLST